MSKIRVEELETLDGLNLAKVEDLAKVGDPETGLDRRVIYVDTVADLQALDTSGLVEGQQASVGKAGVFVWSGTEWAPKNSETITVRIPSDYPTLQEAIDRLSNFKPAQGVIIDLLIESGHEPESGVSVANGDYGHFRISSEDSEVLISENFGTSGSFISSVNSRAPVLNCLVNANEQVGSGYRLNNSSTGVVSDGCGVKKAWGTGLQVLGASTCYASNTVWTECAVNGSTGSGILCVGSVVHANGSTVDDSHYYGAQSSEGGVLAFKDGQASRTGRYGLRARNGGTIDAENATCNDNEVDGVRAFMDGRVHARYITATGNKNTDLWASWGSRISAGNSTLGGIADVAPCYATNSSLITISSSSVKGSASGAPLVLAMKSSIVSANNVEFEDGHVGIQAETGAQVSAEDATMTNLSSYGILCQDGATVSAPGVVIEGVDGDGVRSRRGGKVSIDGGKVIDTSGRGIIAIEGGHISATNAEIEKNPGSTSSGSVADINVNNGGIVYARNAAGGTNNTVNNLTSDGIIFR